MAYVNLIDVIYPVGTIYWTMSATSPATTLGGSWTQITKFPLPQATSTAALQTGGSEYHNHRCEIRYRSYYSSFGAGAAQDGELLWARDWSSGETSSSPSTASNAGHWSSTFSEGLSSVVNNGLQTGSTTKSNVSSCYLSVPSSYTSTMPPYITCYAWYRTS